MTTQDSSQDIRDRTFRHACSVARVALTLVTRPGVRIIAEQLLKAVTSVGANLEEAKAASTRREFARCVDISLKESRESVYWIRICPALQLAPLQELDELRGEAEQITRILGAISVNTKRRMRAQRAVVAVFAFSNLHFALLFS